MALVAVINVQAQVDWILFFFICLRMLAPKP